MYRLKRRKLVIATLVTSIIVFRLTPMVAPFPCVATFVWSDNFDDGNYDGWTIQNGTFSATNNMLVITGSKLEWHVAHHPSTVAYGTWAFDIYLNETEGEYFYIHFIATDAIIHDELPSTCYSIVINFAPLGYHLWKTTHKDSHESVILGLTEYPPNPGWNHIDVTRNTDGQFYVYVNNSLIIGALDNEIQTSNQFIYGVIRGSHPMDNIVVKDEITILPEPADIKFDREDLTVSCQQNSSTSTVIPVRNYGESAGTATLKVGTGSSGITVTCEPTIISNLQYNSYQDVTISVEVPSSVELGSYEIPLELYNDSTLLDTLKLNVTVTSVDTTTKDTTSFDIPVIGVMFVLGIVGAIGLMVVLRQSLRKFQR
ncbi:MAG: hypothetical protein ACFE9L_12405 [Candidatus Hodarchaeota archaeon]